MDWTSEQELQWTGITWGELLLFYTPLVPVWDWSELVAEAGHTGISQAIACTILITSGALEFSSACIIHSKNLPCDETSAFLVYLGNRKFHSCWNADSTTLGFKIALTAKDIVCALWTGFMRHWCSIMHKFRTAGQFWGYCVGLSKDKHFTFQTLWKICFLLVCLGSKVIGWGKHERRTNQKCWSF